MKSGRLCDQGIVLVYWNIVHRLWKKIYIQQSTGTEVRLWMCCHLQYPAAGNWNLDLGPTTRGAVGNGCVHYPLCSE